MILTQPNGLQLLPLLKCIYLIFRFLFPSTTHLSEVLHTLHVVESKVDSERNLISLEQLITILGIRPSVVRNSYILFDRRRYRNMSTWLLEYTYVKNILELRGPYREQHLANANALVDSGVIIAGRKDL